MKLFMVAALLQPTEEQQKKGEIPEIVLDITTVLAKDVDDAKIVAASKVKKEIINDPKKRNRLEVAVRPFC